MSLESHLKFRPARTEDADAIRDVVRAAYARWVPVIGREPLPMKADYQKAVSEHRIDLVCSAESITGLIEMMLREDHLWIENVAVSPEQQGKGLGRRLLAHAETIAKENGLSEVRLLTNAAFVLNVRLYEKTGYVITTSEPFMGGTTLHMSKHLLRDARTIG
jgi:ribosomal protein S18 acetylase RimI-like enzyme